MNIIAGVTKIAVWYCFTEFGAEMAFFTLCYSMHADERDVWDIMIKQNIIIPAFLVMAAVAFTPLFASMAIIFFMAVNTGWCHFIFIEIASMAIIAGRFFVFSQ